MLVVGQVPNTCIVLMFQTFNLGLKKLGLLGHSIKAKYRGFPHSFFFVFFSIFQLSHEIIVKIKVGEY